LFEVSKLKLQVGSRSDVGRVREFNEDSMGMYSPTDPQERAGKGDLFLVADGMGGHAGGEIASRLAVDSILRFYSAWTGEDAAAALIAAVQQANAEIYAHGGGQDGLARMGTTCVGAVVRGAELYIVNVGDSRAYRVRNGRIEQLSRDHSLVAMQVEKGLVDAQQARNLPYRNTITRALGQKPTVEVDHFLHTFQVGDVIVLCTDGLSGQVEDAEIAAAVSRYSPDEAAARLVDLANQCGGPDNISVIIVQAASDTQPVMEASSPSRIAAAPARRILDAWPFILVALAAMLFVGLVAFALLSSAIRPKASPTATPAPVNPPAVVGTSTPRLPVSAATQVLVSTAPEIGPLKIDMTSNLIQLEELAKHLGYNSALEMGAQNPRQGKQITVWPRRRGMLVVGHVARMQAAGPACDFSVAMGDKSYRVTCLANGTFNAGARVGEGTTVSVLGVSDSDTELDAITIDARQPQFLGLVENWLNWYRNPGADRSLWVYTVSGSNTIGDGTKEGIRDGEPVLLYSVWQADRTKISEPIHLCRWNGNHYALVY
jgi:serine/threonine protein phosphatase PrpC